MILMKQKEMPYLYQRLWAFISNYSQGRKRMKLRNLDTAVTSRFRLSKDDWRMIRREFIEFGKMKNKTRQECTIVMQAR